MKVVVYKDKAGQYRWKLLARNRRCLCDSGEGYKTRSGVLTACERMAVDANMSASRVGAAFCMPVYEDGRPARGVPR